MKKSSNEQLSGNMALSERQQRDLNRINKQIDAKVSKTYNHIKGKSSREDVTDKMAHKFDTAAVVVIFSLILLISILSYFATMPKIGEVPKKDSAVSYINIGMYNDTNEIYIRPTEVSIKTQDNKYIGLKYVNWVSTELDTNTEKYTISGTEYEVDKATKLQSLIINDNIVYEEYTNSNNTGNKEFYLSTSKPNDIDTQGFKRLTAAFYEKATSMGIKAYTNSYNNTFLYLKEALGGGEITIKTLKQYVDNLESNIYESDNTDGIIVNLEEFGELNIKKLTDLASVRYSSDTNIVTVYNYEDNIDYFYIANVDNEQFGCNREDLLGTDNENIYLTYGFDNEDSNNYLTFGIKTDNNLYIVKINPLLKDTITEWFKSETEIDLSELKIKNIQNVIYKDGHEEKSDKKDN